MLVSSLISSIRYKVGDHQNSTKWSDERIIDLINEGLDDLARKAYIYKSSISLPILPYQRELVIPDENFIVLLKIKIDKQLIELVPFAKLDKITNWEESIGSEITAVAYDLQNPRHLTLYPLLDETSTNYDAINNATGFLLDVPNIDRDYLYGIITAIDASNTIVPENVYDPNNIDTYGGVTSIEDNFFIADIQYSAVPPKITAITDDVGIEDSYIQTLVYYVSGMLLLDDNRTESVNKGTLFIQKYTVELKENAERNAISFQDVVTPTIDYRTGF